MTRRLRRLRRLIADALDRTRDLWPDIRRAYGWVHGAARILNNAAGLDAATGVFLAELARAVPAGTRAALVLDGAGRHVSEGLSVPPNLTLIHPPPYSPELNPVERVWECLRDRRLSHRVLAGGYAAVVDAACPAWNALLAAPGRLRSLTNFPWLPP